MPSTFEATGSHSRMSRVEEIIQAQAPSEVKLHKSKIDEMLS